MKRKAILIPALLLCLAGQVLPQKNREAVFAGRFYDHRPKALSLQIENYLKGAEEMEMLRTGLTALIVPHAGYSCSGPIAAYAYRLIKGLDIDTVVVVGTSHGTALSGCSIYPEGGYETPLGVAQIDTALALEITRLGKFKFYPQAHQSEHSIEVQIPFIQTVLPQAKIVPILMGAPTEKTILTLAEALKKALQKKRALVIASTDLSHYYSKEKARRIDSNTISLITSCDTEAIVKKLRRRENIMCGGGGVVSALLFSQNSTPAEIKVLKYADSSDTCGTSTNVVGYLAAAIYSPNPGPDFSLNGEGKKELLSLTREALQRFLSGLKLEDIKPQNAQLQIKRGAFVTLKKKGALRGCIGFIKPVAPLYQTVIQAALYAAVKDSRFNPVQLSELEGLEIEISVLTPLQKIDDPKKILVGTHGLFISLGDRSGLLLPQVPVENNWSRTTFLEQACLKAGLQKNAWKSGADIFVFQAIVFHE